MNEQENTAINEIGTNGAEPEKQFTQDDVNRIVSDRLKRERGKLETDALAALGEREREITRKEVSMLARERIGRLRLPEQQAHNLLAELSGAESVEELERNLKLIEKATVPAGVPGRGSPPISPSFPDAIRKAMGLK